MKKVSIIRFYFVCFLINSMNCVVLPILPTIFKNNNFPDYMFGVAFAVMSAGMFLFSPFWGRVGDRIGHSNVLILTSLGYMVGQACFYFSSGIWSTLFARFLSGVFAGGIMVAFMSYVTNSSTGDKQRTRYMSYYAAVLSLSNSMGYFLGGVMGNISIPNTFIFQGIVMALSCAFILFFMAEPVVSEEIPRVRKSINPFMALAGVRDIASKAFTMFLIAVFLSTFATISFDNVLNYFIKDQFDFPSSYNGYIKAIVGIIGLVANVTINTIIAEKTNIRTSIVYILVMCGVTAGCLFFIDNVTVFIVVTLIHFTVNAIYLPILQVLATESSDKSNTGTVTGTFNAVRSLGMVVGSAIIGFIYMYNSRLPFLFIGTIFLMGAGVCLAYKRLKAVNIMKGK